jgi:DNA-binding phage protein
MDWLYKDANIFLKRKHELYYHSIKDIENRKNENRDINLFLSPCGKIIEVRNMSQFAKERNLNRYCLYDLKRKRTTQHKGWKFIENEKVLKL